MVEATTRRSLLAAAGAAAAAGLAPGALVQPGRAAEPDRVEWDRLVQVYRRAEANYVKACAGADEAEQRYFQVKPDRPTRPSLPPMELLSFTLMELRDLPSDATHAEHERQVDAWRAECDALEEEMTGAQVRARDAAFEPFDDALHDLETYQAPTLSIAAEKAALIFEEIGRDAGEHMRCIVDDLARFAREVAHA